MSVEENKNDLLPLEISAIKLEKVPYSALILENGLWKVHIQNILEEGTGEGNASNFVNGCAR